MIGNRYKYKESSVCRVIDDTMDNFGRVLVFWEVENYTGWVDVSESSYKKL